MTELRFDRSEVLDDQRFRAHLASKSATALQDEILRQTYSLATDWKRLTGPAQSGLPYRWSDGLPVQDKWTQTQAVQLILKRLVDIVLASSALLFLLPMLLFVALAIKLTSRGPVFFRQDRVGKGGETFKIFKFRTMFIDREDATGVRQTKANDDRVTPIGQLLRAKSIDELPQLINVLLGDMSLVGPRPHVAGMLAGGMTYETLVPYYGLRYAMAPGLTGWAQANGYRGPTDDPVLAFARIDHDLAYIQNFSLGLDIKIIVMTAWVELTRGTGV
jgi:polysaccharide biosynthesis protein PslA